MDGWLRRWLEAELRREAQSVQLYTLISFVV